MTTFYGEQHRRLQDQFDSREIADVLAAAIVRPDIDDDARAFIESRTFFFLSTVDADGRPTSGAASRYAPDANGESPWPGWKRIDALQPFLPRRFQRLAEADDDLITADEYGNNLLRGDG